MFKKLAYFSCLAVILRIAAYLYCPMQFSVDKTNKYLLSNQQLNKFNKEGYLIIRNLFSSDEINIIKNDFQSAYELTQQQLEMWGCKYHELIMNEKPHYDLLICDKSIRIDDI